MSGAKPGKDRMRDRIALGLLALALLMRVMVPAGWMPAAGNGMAITLCTGMGPVAAWIDADGKVHKQGPSDSRSDQPCAFSGLGTAFDLPTVHDVSAAPLPAGLPLLAAQAATVDIGRGLAAPPPPATGPPANL